MTVVIAYQSLNSNAAHTHGLAASTSQHFTVEAQRTLADKYPKADFAKVGGALRYPTSEGIEPHHAIEGPAELVPIESGDFMDSPKVKRTHSQMISGDLSAHQAAVTAAQIRTLTMVEGKARQTYQMAYREMGEKCDVIVFGELDSTHPDWRNLHSSAGALVSASIVKKACNCFSIHSSGSTAKMLEHGIGWCAVKCREVVTVFVHVPNSIAKKPDEAIRFYEKIRSAVLQKTGDVIDIVMGDTNQDSATFSPEVVSKGLEQTFADAHTGKTISPSDLWSPNGVSHKGTNSADSKKYDVVLYNTATVEEANVRYSSQISFAAHKAAAYTDHMGLLVKVTKR